MLRGYRGIILSLVGLALAAAVPPSNEAPDQPKSEDNVGGQLKRIATAFEKLPKAPAPDRGCQPGHDDYQSDLCAQWKAALAARNAADWSWWTMLASFLGLVIGGGTLFAAWRAAHWAKKAADHTEAGASAAFAAVRETREANSIAARSGRPWVTVTGLSLDPLKISKDDEEGLSLGFTGRIFVRNIGKEIAGDFGVIARAIPFEESFPYLHRTADGGIEFPQHPMGTIPDNLGPADERTIHFTVIEAVERLMSRQTTFCISVAVLYTSKSSGDAEQHVLWQTWDVGQKVGTRSTMGWDREAIVWKVVLPAEVGLRHTHTLT